MRALLAAAALAAIALAVSPARPTPMIPGSSDAMTPATPPSAGPAPPSCSTSLNFGQACNSQYLGALIR